MKKMTSTRPYLLRAFYDWIVDNDMTPYILVDVNYPGTEVPMDYAQNDQIVLNISPSACRGLMLENDRIVFTARFAGQPTQISLYPGAVMEIYAKENGRGLSFPPEDDDLPPPAKSKENSSKPKKPSLKLVE